MFVLTIAASCTLPAVAQTEAELEAQIRESLENAQELLNNLPTLQQIEADEAAMRDLLNRTQDDLTAERARRAALEAQLQQLTGAGHETRAADPQADVVRSDSSESSLWLALPPRSVNALGMLDISATLVGQVPEGTEAIVLRWPQHVRLPDAVTWPSVDIEGPRARLFMGSALGQRRELGVFEIRGNALFWSWQGGSQANASKDAWIEPLLRRTWFEAQRAGVALARFQVAPRSLGLPEPLPTQGTKSFRLLDDLGVDPTLAPIVIVIESDGRWARLEADSNQAAWVGRDASLWVQLATDSSILQIRRGPGLDARLDALARQRQAWQRDLDHPASDDSTLAQAQTELDRLDLEAEQLQALRDALPDTPSANEAHATLLSTQPVAPIVRLVDPQSGVVLVRLTLATDTFPTR
ncbi:MAG: hypothetical protein AAGF84_05985 [Planctomycetota bacterium]